MKTTGLVLGSLAVVAGLSYLSKRSESLSETCASCGAEGECGCKAFSKSFGEVVDFGERRRRQEAKDTVARATEDMDEAVGMWNWEVGHLQEEIANHPKPNRSLLRRVHTELGVTNRMASAEFHRLMGYERPEHVPVTPAEDLDPEELAISLRYASKCAMDAALFMGATIDEEHVFENPKVQEALSRDLGRTDEDYKKLLCEAIEDSVRASSKFATLSAFFYTMAGGNESLGRGIMLKEAMRMEDAIGLVSSRCGNGILRKTEPPKAASRKGRRFPFAIKYR